MADCCVCALDEVELIDVVRTICSLTADPSNGMEYAAGGNATRAVVEWEYVGLG